MKKARSISVRVRVPATTANLGPGYDVLGLALALYNEVELLGKADGRGALSGAVIGEGEEALPINRKNLVFRAFEKAGGLRGRKKMSWHLRLVNRVPLARGLGSSSAAIVGGALAAQALKGRKALSQKDLLKLIVQLEGHPDNVVPALLGGLCASAVGGQGNVDVLSWKKSPFLRQLRAVVCVPNFQLPTAKARKTLPAQVPRQDGVFNSSRVALLLGALEQGQYDLLGRAMEDRLHQPYRKKLIPGFDQVLGAARKAGAFGAALSGAGPSVLAFVSPRQAPAVGRAMVRAFSRKRVKAHFLNLSLDRQGARVTFFRK